MWHLSLLCLRVLSLTTPFTNSFHLSLHLSPPLSPPLPPLPPLSHLPPISLPSPSQLSTPRGIETEDMHLARDSLEVLCLSMAISPHVLATLETSQNWKHFVIDALLLVRNRYIPPGFVSFLHLDQNLVRVCLPDYLCLPLQNDPNHSR